MSELIAFDTFAGTGWGVACHWLGIREYGVELMPEAVATRDAVGMTTVYRDVWDGILDPAKVPAHDIKISSPPCQTFSAAGNGGGRRALGDVLAAVKAGVYMRPLDLYELTKSLDPRTALVLTPLAHIYRERPRLVALEQVPQVLPVWEAYAAVMREWGYSVAVGVLNAEQFGVPQTRRRAILVARRDGREARLPAPAHSRYYSREPKRFDDGVLPWISMADALGMDGFTAEKAMGKGMVERYGERPGRDASQPAFTIRAAAGGMEPGGFILRSNCSSGSGGEAPEGSKLARTERSIDEPATTITSKAGSMKFVRRGLEDRPAPTITGGGTETGGAEPIAKLARYTESEAWVGDTRRLSIEEAAVLQSYPQWIFDRPAPTVVGTRRSEGGMLIGRQLADGSRRDVGGHQTSVGLREGQLEGVRVSGQQAAALQSYPTPFPFQGTKGKQFLQVGNAVPPLMAAAILAELIAPPEPLDEWQTAFLGSTADHLAV